MLNYYEIEDLLAAFPDRIRHDLTIHALTRDRLRFTILVTGSKVRQTLCMAFSLDDCVVTTTAHPEQVQVTFRLPKTQADVDRIVAAIDFAFVQVVLAHGDHQHLFSWSAT
jgi:hypothetical protein